MPPLERLGGKNSEDYLRILAAPVNPDSQGVLAKLDETQIADEANGIMAPDPEPVEAVPVRGQWRDFMHRIFDGRKDRLEYFAPGAWKEVELSEMDGARVRAGVLFPHSLHTPNAIFTFICSIKPARAGRVSALRALHARQSVKRSGRGIRWN